MEDASNQKKWFSLVMVVASIVGTMALLGYLSIRFLPSDGTAAYSSPSGREQASSATVKDAPSDWADDTGALAMHPVKSKYILHKDIQKQIGKSIVTYRGKSDGSRIKLDVIVLDLDPEVTYARTLDIARAKKSFHVGDERFELISVGSLRLRVWYYH